MYRGGAVYENAFMAILRRRKVNSLRISQGGTPSLGAKPFKSPDFIVSSFNGKYIIEVKGTRDLFHSWIREGDVRGLAQWARELPDLKPLLVFVWNIDFAKRKDLERNGELLRDQFSIKGSKYAFTAALFAAYYPFLRMRDRGWGAYDVPRDRLREILRPASYFVPEIHRA